MIPTIETIVEELLAGTLPKHTAINWLYQHAEGSANDLRDYFAGLAMQARLAGTNLANLDKRHAIASDAYSIADAMLKARES